MWSCPMSAGRDAQSFECQRVARSSCRRGGAGGMGKWLRDNMLRGADGDTQKYAIFVGCNRGGPGACLIKPDPDGAD